MSRIYPALFVFLWATGYIGARMSAPYSEPLSFLSLRFAIVAAVLALVVAVMRLPWPSRRQMVNSLIAGALIQGVYLGGVFWAIENGMPAGVAALIVGLQPIATAILARPFLGEPVDRRNWLGLAIGLLGLAMVVWPKLEFSGYGITPATFLSVGLGMLAISVGSVWQKRTAGGLDTRVDGMFQFIAGCAVVSVGAAFTESFTFIWTPQLFFALAWLVIALSLGAITLYLILLRQGEASKVAGLFYLVPAVAAFIGWLLFDETLTPVQIAGMAITVGAVALVSAASSTKDPAPPSDRPTGPR